MNNVPYSINLLFEYIYKCMKYQRKQKITVLFSLSIYRVTHKVLDFRGVNIKLPQNLTLYTCKYISIYTAYIYCIYVYIYSIYSLCTFIYCIYTHIYSLCIYTYTVYIHIHTVYVFIHIVYIYIYTAYVFIHILYIYPYIQYVCT